MGTITPLARMEINWAYVGCLKFGPKLGKLTVYTFFEKNIHANDHFCQELFLVFS